MSEKSQNQLRSGHLADFQPGGDLLKSPLPQKRGIIGAVKSLIIFSLAIWLFPDSAAIAKPTTADQAQHLARFWLAHHNNRPLDTLLGSQIKGTKIFRNNAGDILYFVISLAPDGFVIVPGDDLVEPIIAFAPHGEYDPSEQNPLTALVSRDVPRRLVLAQEEEAQARARGVPFEPRGFRRQARDKWERWQGEPLTTNAPADASLAGVSDVRVAPLVQSKWSQTTEGSNACYNYYTPPGSPDAASNYPSGCVATAMAQTMRYFQWPTAGVGTSSFAIKVNGISQNNTLLGGDGLGRPYNWTSMVLDPNSSTSAPQRQAIGALTSDAGVAVHMNYAASGSGASLRDARNAMVNTFGYSNAIWGRSSTTISTDSLIPMLNPNLDAALPVLLGIYGSAGGHAVVADGYGYNTSTLYHHLNLGWAGTANAWYNLPTINAGGYSFTEVGDCIYNIYTSGGGEIISGRVLDAVGDPLSGATVTATRTNGSTYRATTNTQGIYALAMIPSSSTYTLTALKPRYRSSSRVVSTGFSMNQSNPGNLWGPDFSLPKQVAVNQILDLLLFDN